MVRAAASGAVDYSRADPRDRNWRLRHKLVLHELARKESYDFLTLVHAHWRAYAARDNLTAQSVTTVKDNLNKTLKAIEDIAFSKNETPKQSPQPQNTAEKPVVNKKPKEPKKDTILDKDTAALVAKYRELKEKGQI
jgi:hypothetical protein